MFESRRFQFDDLPSIAQIFIALYCDLHQCGSKAVPELAKIQDEIVANSEHDQVGAV